MVVEDIGVLKSLVNQSLVGKMIGLSENRSLENLDFFVRGEMHENYYGEDLKYVNNDEMVDYRVRSNGLYGK